MILGSLALRPVAGGVFREMDTAAAHRKATLRSKAQFIGGRVSMTNRGSIHDKHIISNSRGARVLAAAVAFLLGSLCVAVTSRAADDKSYQALRHWLEQDRAPQPAFEPGQRLTLEHRDALEPFIPQSAWEYYFFPDMEMEIAATGHYPPPPEWGKNVTPGYSLDEQGVLAGFTGGGFPFPEIEPQDPQAALKVLWNMWWRPGAEGYVMPMVAWSRGKGGRLDRRIEWTIVNARYAQGAHCLVPGYEEVRSKMLIEFRSPRDMAGAKNLSVIYVDHYKEDDGWMYLPSERKPRRMLASERTSETLGMDFISEDQMGFGGKTYEQNWTYLGKKAVLGTINVRDNPEPGGPNLWVPNKARWEARECHVILVEPKKSSHPYSHKIIFIDAETFWTLWMFAFDRDERLFRMNQHFLKYSESYGHETPQQAPYLQQDYSDNLGHHVLIHLGETDIDAKKPHATYSHCYVVMKEFSSGRAKQFYSLRNMVSGRR